MLKDETVQSSTHGVSPEKISKMEEKSRKTGIDAVGDAPFGTHFCLFYGTKEDLIDVLVPYFKAGLESNEFCMWVTSEPLSEEEAKEAMRRAVPNFDRYVERGQIEIVPHTEWYLKGGAFSLQRVLNGWVEKLNQALAKGYDGMRVTGNTFWLEQRGWKNFVDYEQEINRVIGKYRMIALCTYSLEKCATFEILDGVCNHQFAVIKREGKWELIESSEFKRAEEALQENEERFRQVAENAQEWIWEVDSNGLYTYASPVAERMLGYKSEEIVGKKHFYDLFAPEDREALKKAAFKAFTQKQDFREFVNRNVHKQGKLVWLSTSGTPILDKKGNLLGYRGTDTDITERKRTEEALQESERRLKNIVDNSSDQIFMLDRDCRFLVVNKSAADLFGLSPQEMVGRSISEVFPETIAAQFSKNIKNVFDTGKRMFLDEKMVAKGRELYTSTSLNPVKNDNGRVITVSGIVRDITERKQMEEKLKQYSEQLEALVQKRTKELSESEKRYSVLVEEASDGVAILQDGKIVFTNNKGAEIVGYSKDEIVGLPFGKLVSEKYRQLTKERYEQRVRGENVASTYEIEVVSKNGTQVPVELSATRIQYQGRQADLLLVRDISERKRMEEQRSKLERLAAIGEAAGMVGHDLRNPLQVITNTLYLSEKKSKSVPITEKEILEKHGLLKLTSGLKEQVEYMDKIVSDLQDYASPVKPTPVEIGLHQLINKTLSSLAVPENVKVSILIEKDFPKLTLDPTLMQRVFSNLITNAVQAMPNGGKITIKASKKEETALISIEDTGAGIPDENLSKLFTPLFTTKAKGQGFGLPVCKRLVEAHDGNITVKSKVGKGSTFTIKIPLREEVS
jgi:PAS domain S-box-containing protein